MTHKIMLIVVAIILSHEARYNLVEDYDGDIEVLDSVTENMWKREGIDHVNNIYNKYSDKAINTTFAPLQ